MDEHSRMIKVGIAPRGIIAHKTVFEAGVSIPAEVSANEGYEKLKQVILEHEEYVTSCLRLESYEPVLNYSVDSDGTAFLDYTIVDKSERVSKL